MRRWAIASWLALLAWPAAAQNLNLNAEALLDRASRALQTTDFHGTLTYEFGSVLETLEVVHQVEDGVEFDRIHHLNGAEREFVRAGRRQSCVTVGSSLLRGGLLSNSDGPVSLTANYHLSIRGGERLAGREAVVIHAAPKDEFRYAMTLALDRVTSIPLLSLISSDQTVLERFQFVSFAVGDAGAAKDPRSSVFKQLDGERVQCADAPMDQVPFAAGWLPPGFVLSQANRAGAGAALTYTDGLSAFTIFVEPHRSSAPPAEGTAWRGASIVMLDGLTTNGQPHQVALIGEVPMAAAERIVANFGPRATD